ncbi:hypothetical protein MKW94_002343 [Papaver nudicaule]|uniref:Bromo domain-containing protein n=1 Tax=Papaver nudicaule TaxID=74823 RepID=A0AA42B070_PAPNU|nr:hypothetical protein [Papaver nudicaule]
MEVRHRRSARISALEASRICQVGEEYTQQEKQKGKLVDYFEDSDSSQELSNEKRRGNKRKRKLRAVEDVTAVIPVERAVNLTHEQIVAISPEGPPRNNGSQFPLPSTIHPPAAKRLFELIIDILEKKDKNKIFSEPVDPEVCIYVTTKLSHFAILTIPIFIYPTVSDVKHFFFLLQEAEGYYDIIKVPMDFSTIKKKIHDGLYTTLDEFERDVFLIPSNAMHYNGEGTFYFKQGYAIYELAKKAFYTVRNDPRNYEVSLADIIPKPGRKPGSHSRAANNGSNGTSTGGARRGRPTLHGSSGLARRTHSPRHLENCSDGTVESRRISKPWKDFISEDESIASIVYDSAKQLVNVNREGNAYSQSLSNFSKGMGERVQTVADRKLLAASQIAARNSLIAATSSSQQSRNPQNNAINIPKKSQDFYHNFPGRSSIPNPAINISNTYNVINNNPALPIIPNSQISTLSNPKSHNLLSNLSSFPTYQSLPTNFSGKSNFRASFREENSKQNQSQNSNIQMGSNVPTTSVRDLNLPVNGVENHRNGFPTVDSGKLANNNPSPDLVSRMHASKLAEYICRNNNTFEDSTRFRAMMEANSNHVSNCIPTSGSRAAETRTITVPGPSYRVNPVPKWNQPNPILQPVNNQGRNAPTPVYGNNVSLLGHGMEWGEQNLGSNSFGRQNHIISTSDLGIAATQPVLDWNRLPSSSRAGKQPMEAPGAVHGTNLAQSSFSSHSLSTERQEMGPPGFLYGSKFAQTSSTPHWNQSNFNSNFLGGQNHSMNLPDVSNGVDLNHGGLLTVPNPEWQLKPFPPSIDMSDWQNQQAGIDLNLFNQEEGAFQREYPVPEVALVGQLGFCGRPTYGNQTELSTLSLLDQQQPDLALQL